jgi:hypothetical protein
MNSPWQVLEIPPGSPVAVIKKAYAKLLRQHRPDVDPAGFRRLRDAYEQALAWVESGASMAEVEDPEPPTGIVWFEVGPAAAPAPPAPSGSQLPVESPATTSRPRDLVVALRDALARARSDDRPQRRERLTRLLAKLLQRADADPAFAQLAGEELRQNGSPLRWQLHLGVAHGMWGSDGVPLRRALLLAHVAAGDFDRLWSAADELSSLVGSAADPLAAAQAVDAVPVLAFLDPSRASQLADAVFRSAASGMRDLLATTEVWIQAGLQLRERHLAEARPQFALALCDPRVGDEDPIARRALELAVQAPRAPLVAQLLADRFPTAWPQFEPEWRRARNRLGKRPAAVKEGGRDWRLVFWLVLALSVLGRFLSVIGPSQPKLSKELLEQIERGTYKWRSSVGLPDSSNEPR